MKKKWEYFILKYDKFIRLSFEMKLSIHEIFLDLHTTMLLSVALEILSLCYKKTSEFKWNKSNIQIQIRDGGLKKKFLSRSSNQTKQS